MLWMCASLLSLAPAGASHAIQVLPTLFIADRVFVTPQTSDGQTMKLFTDTGGGLFLTEQAAQRLHLAIQTLPFDTPTPESSPARQQAVLPRFKPGLGIPMPADGKDRIAIMPAARVTKNKFDEGTDGMLGEEWFGGRVWTWDYPNQRLTIEAAEWKPAKTATRIALGFPVDKKGEHEDNFARIAVRVDGKSIDMLLDTGATANLTPETTAALADGLPAERATSFIVDTQFQAWRTAHPEWRVVEKSQSLSNAAMIEVPEVEIAGMRVGPVWFTWRPDKNFHEFMSSMMDKQVEGAVGGNVFRHFMMTIDYPKAVAWFQCTRECNPRPQSAP